MINQVTLEGFVVSRWQYKGDEFIRLAHHRPRRKGELIHSDYITVRVAQNTAALPSLQQGDLVRVQGEVWGKDILEPLGKVFQKAKLNVDLPPELENLILPRPTAYVLAQKVDRVDSKEEAYAKAAKRAGRPVILREKKVVVLNDIVDNNSSSEMIEDPVIG
jgi:hypothetical protein